MLILVQLVNVQLGHLLAGHDGDRHDHGHLVGHVHVHGRGRAACATSALKISQSAPNGYAGGVIVTLVFTNASGAACTLYGYPGVSLVSSAQTQIGLAAKRSGTAVKLIALGPGATASASLQIVDALNFPSTTCDPVKAAYLRVYPPNQTASVLLPNTSQTCSKPVQTLTINPVQAGSGSS